jgi:hypothetical protein
MKGPLIAGVALAAGARVRVALKQITCSVVFNRPRAMMIDPRAKLLAIRGHTEEYRGFAIRAKDRGERKTCERIVELYVQIAEELEALMDGPDLKYP